MAHTLGEWHWACDSYGKVQHSRKYDCVYSTIKGKKGEGDRIVSIAARIESSYDARLMSVAPALLAACKELVRAFVPSRDSQSPEQLKVFDAVCAIIDRATGKDNMACRPQIIGDFMESAEVAHAR